MRKILLPALMLSSSVAILACSSSSSSPTPTSSSQTPTTVVTGSVNNISLAASSATGNEGVVATSTVNGEATNVQGINVLISNKSNTCGSTHGQGAIGLALVLYGDVSGAPGPGSLTVVDADKKLPVNGQAEAHFITLGSTCQDTFAQTATSGTITVAEVLVDLTNPSNSHVSGSFDITFPDGHVTGSFDSVLCDRTIAGAADGGTPTPVCD